MNYKSSDTIAVFLYWARAGKTIQSEKSFYPAYFEHDYGITDPQGFHQFLIDEGYLTLPSIEQSLKTLTVNELKNILREHNLKLSGKKIELISRLLESLSEETLEKICSSKDKKYVLSKKGDLFLQENYIHVLFHKHENWELTYEAYEMMCKNMKKTLDFYDFAWITFNERQKEYTINHQWSQLRINYYYRYQLLEKEGKFTDCFFSLLNVLYFDLSGICDGDRVIPFNLLIIPPAIEGDLEYYSKYYSPEMIEKCYIQVLPFNYFDQETFTKIVEKILSGKGVNLNQYKEFANVPDAHYSDSFCQKINVGETISTNNKYSKYSSTQPTQKKESCKEIIIKIDEMDEVTKEKIEDIKRTYGPNASYKIEYNDKNNTKQNNDPTPKEYGIGCFIVIILAIVIYFWLFK